MIAGSVASNRRIIPFITGSTEFNPSGSTGVGETGLYYLNNEYVLADGPNGDIMTSSDAISGYSDVITANAPGAAIQWSYENGRYFAVNRTTNDIYTGTTVSNTQSTVAFNSDIRSPIVWHAPTNAWWAAGDDGNAQSGGGCLVKYSTNGTSWTTITSGEPSTLRLLGIASNGTRLVLSSEGATGTPHVIKYSTSTNPASMTWISATSPFSSQYDIGSMKYHPEKSTFTCGSAQAVFAYSTDSGTTWTAKDLGWSYNGRVLIEWVPWHNRWVATIDTNRQFAVSNTSDIAGTWTLGTGSTASTSPSDFITLLVDPNRNYVIVSGVVGSGNNMIRSI